MKRVIVGLTCSLGLAAGSALAEDDAPAARLGRPAASLGRPMPDARAPIYRAAAPEIPKQMPKGKVGEEATPKTDPGILPVPGGPSVPMLDGMPNVIPPGAVTGPIVTGPVTSGPFDIAPGTVIGPEFGDPMGSCPIPGGTCGVPSRWYGGAEYLLYWMKSYATPPLVTVGPVGSGGFLGNPGVTTLFGDSPISANPRHGGRISLGYWLSPKWAIEANAFFLGTTGEHFAVASEQFPNSILARPFFSLNQNREFAEQIGNPNTFAGFVQVDTKSFLFGYDVNARRRLWESCNNKFDVLVGYRYLDLTESLTIREQPRGLAGAPAPFVGVEQSLTDRFRTSNQFHGGQVGAIFEHTSGRWSFDVKTKVALGVSVQSTDINGGINTVAGNVAPDRVGGLLALNSNIGHYTRSTFAVVPEVNLNVGYDVTSHLRAFVGYNFLYWSDVARPGAQIDRTLDENRIPNFTMNRTVPAATSSRPVGQVESESFWVQGINFGLLFKW